MSLDRSRKDCYFPITFDLLALEEDPSLIKHKGQLRRMTFNQLDICTDNDQVSSIEDCAPPNRVSLETEIPEALYRGMKDFISTNPNWDQYKLMSSALANFLFQNGCSERSVTEKYLNDLFTRGNA